MRIPLTAIISALVTLAPFTAQAACEGYDLTAEQIAVLPGDIDIPDGEVPVITRCDTNGDNSVDINDIRNIALARNQPAKHPTDPWDWNGDFVINLLDVRGCQRACALSRCAVDPSPPAPEDPQDGGTTTEAECTQAEDFNGDGKEDFVGIYENTGEQRSGNYNLSLVILNEDEQGNIRQTTFPYSGQVTTDETGQEVVNHHLAVQPAGPVNLAPGSITIDQPAVVSYRHGRPAVIYYWQDGQLNRAFYGVDD